MDLCIEKTEEEAKVVVVFKQEGVTAGCRRKWVTGGVTSPLPHTSIFTL
jgi:hypothetical protein